MGKSIVSADRQQVIARLCKQVHDLPGQTAEVGVYRGGTAMLIATHLPEKTLHLFDTFTGIPVKDATIDKHEIGDFNDTSIEQVKEYLQHQNVQFHVGIFPFSIPGPLKSEEFAFVHLDADQYQSTRHGLEFFYPRLVVGGVIVMDDYKFSHCPGATKALDEFLANKPEVIRIDTPDQAYFVKIHMDLTLPETVVA